MDHDVITADDTIGLVPLGLLRAAHRRAARLEVREAHLDERVGELRAREIAVNVAESLDVVGLLAIEMFLLEDGSVLVNEMAPRPHNSGHQTIEGNYTSQFEQHLRSVLGLPLGSTDPIMPSAMINLLGAEGHTGPVKYAGLEEAMAIPGVYPHIYGKSTTKPFRKMGHVAVIHPDAQTCQEIALKVKDMIRVEAE